MKATKIISACAVLVALASCSNDHVISQPGAEDTPIRIQANVGAVTTKAASDINEGTFYTGAQVGIFLREHLASNETAIKVYTNNTPIQGTLSTSSGTNQNITLETPQYFPSNGRGVDCLAIYPKQYNSTDIANGVTSFSVLETQDDEGYKKSDLMYAYKEDTKNSSGGTINLTFSHLLSKIVIKLNVDQSSGADKSILADAYIDLLNTHVTTSITVSDMSQDTSTPSSNGSQDAKVELVSTSTDDSDKKTIRLGCPGKSDADDGTSKSAAAIIVPQTISSGTAFIQVRLRKSGEDSDYAKYTYTVGSSQLSFASGYKYEYTITLKAGGIDVESVKINEWGNGESNGTGDAKLD